MKKRVVIELYDEGNLLLRREYLKESEGWKPYSVIRTELEKLNDLTKKGFPLDSIYWEIGGITK